MGRTVDYRWRTSSPLTTTQFLGGCTHVRGVAQFGSAIALGAMGRRFKSCHSDHAGLAQW